MMADKEVVQTPEKQVYTDSSLEVHHSSFPNQQPLAYRQYHNETADDKHIPHEEPATICGVPKRVFLCVVVFAAVSLGIAIALGVGLGIGLRGQARSDSTSSASGTATTSTAATSTTSGVTMYTGTRSSSCPYSNGTTTTTAGLTYVIICDSAVLSPNKTDLFRVYQPSFGACLELCASKGRKDVSMIYNYAGTFGQVEGTCWCSANTAPGMNTTVQSYTGNDVALIQ